MPIAPAGAPKTRRARSGDGAPPLHRAVRSMPREQQDICAQQQRLSVSRHCPHAGNDLLQTGEVLPGGLIRCLAHHYDFDLRTGACLTGNYFPEF
jgi:hypothetical protein